MIRLEGVTKRFKNQLLFENIDLELREKKIKIKGENGTGKSVLLKLIVGYSVPDTGRIYFDESKELRKNADFIQNAGVMINAPQFMKNWSGLENLMYLRNINKTCSEERLYELIEFFQLTKDIEKKYKTYSLGMQQKLRLIQALMDEPKYLILDEPFDALDKNTKIRTREYLEQYIQADPSRKLIFTSHSEEDDGFANQIIVIEDQNCFIL